MLISLDAGLPQAAFHFVDLKVDTDRLTMRADQLENLCIGDARRGKNQRFERETPLSISAQPVAVAVLFGQAELVQHRIRPVRLMRRPESTVLRPGIVWIVVGRNDGPPLADAKPEGLVQFLAIDRQR